MDGFNETFEQLEALVGRENAEKVFRFFEGASVYFPKSFGLGERHERMFAELMSGKTYREVALKYGYTKSYVRKIENKKRKEKRRDRAGGVKAASDASASRGGEPAKRKPKSAFGQGELFCER
jgi:hypothetical protein